MEQQERPSLSRQNGKMAFELGKGARLTVEVDVSSAGLLSIGAIVAMTLLSTAVLVWAATGSRRPG